MRSGSIHHEEVREQLCGRRSSCPYLVAKGLLEGALIYCHLRMNFLSLPIIKLGVSNCDIRGTAQHSL